MANEKRQMKNAPRWRVAIVHDWLVGGGAEKVVLELHKMFPEAPIYTSYCTRQWREKLDDMVVTGYLQHLGKLRKFLALPRQWWFARLDLADYDLVISSSGNGEAKFIKTGAGTTHICYCHSPVHFYWSKYDEYIANPGFRPKWLIRLALKVLVRPLRKRDFKAAQNVDYFIANSNHIKDDIKKYYRRSSEVIFPPVNLERFDHPRQYEREGFIIVGRQTTYKKYALAVEACNKLKLPLTVVGNGPDHASLVKLAGKTIRFIEDANDSDVASLLAQAAAFIFTPIEDFGIAPIEALASGTPVLAYKAGGALDYIQPGKNGEFFDKQTVDSLVAALKKFNPSKYKIGDIKSSAKRFSNRNFQISMTKFLRQKLQNRP